MKKLIATLALIPLFGFGCSSISDKISQKVGESATEAIINKGLGGEGKVDVSGDSLSFKGKDGDIAFGENAKIPSNFPTDVPTIDGAKVVMVTVGKTEPMSAGYVVQAKGTVDGVAKDFIAAIVAKGWKSTSETQINEGGYYSYEKDGAQLTIAISGSDDASEVFPVSVTASYQGASK